MNYSETEICSVIKESFPVMKDQKDLLSLINKIDRMLHADSNKRRLPISENSFNYYKNSKISFKRRYKTFNIPKKSGKIRVINAPCSRLKRIQRALNAIFSAYYEQNDYSCGFVAGKNLTDGAKKHVRKSYVLNIDLKDFFDSIEMYRIKAILTLPPFNLKSDRNNPQDIAFTIANLCCHPKEVTRLDADGKEMICVRNVLPQGAPTSPVLTNLVCRQLDRRLAGLSKRYRASYSRYADDITFSANRNIFHPESGFCKELRRIIEDDQKFRINNEKTRVQGKGYRQKVTGITVNEKVSLGRRYVKQLRMWLYLWEEYGYEQASEYFKNDYTAARGYVKSHNAEMINVISGKLDYMKMVVGADNETYRKLNNRYRRLIEIRNPELSLTHSGHFIKTDLDNESVMSLISDIVKRL